MSSEREVLNAERGSWNLPSNIYSAGDVRGLYSPNQFVVRINPKLQDQLAAINSGVYKASDLGLDVISAFSTYLHETIHWWQHVGSSLGLILSMCYPAQTHINHKELKYLLSKIGPKKSLRSFHLQHASSFSSDVEQSFNRVLNYWHDIEFGYRLLLSPESSRKWALDKYFESVGHSYHITWGSCLSILSSVVDPVAEVLPDGRKWDEGFADLSNRKIDGYYYKSPILLPPLGAMEIFEGQARFSQLQFLYFSSGGSLDWEDFRKQGMLQGIYIAAFKTFLKLIEEAWPSSVDDPLVALFLLVCELSINPTEGFPFDIRYFESFIFDVDPGFRFYLFTQAIKKKYPSMKTAITNYSREEYIEVSEILCREGAYYLPLIAAEKVAAWPQESVEFHKLMEEDATFEFTSTNLPIRLFLSRYIGFQQDKSKHPEFFTWPGVWFVDREDEKLPLEEALQTFNRNVPLFVDAPDGEIRPSLIPGKAEANIYETFSQFYMWNANYNMIRQWIVEDGPFKLDFGWLTKRYTKDEMHSWATDIFSKSFGVKPSEFTLVN